MTITDNYQIIHAVQYFQKKNLFVFCIKEHAMWTLTGEILEAVSAAPFPFPVGDIKTNRHRPADGQVAVRGNPHAQQTLE